MRKRWAAPPPPLAKELDNVGRPNLSTLLAVLYVLGCTRGAHFACRRLFYSHLKCSMSSGWVYDSSV